MGVREGLWDRWRGKGRTDGEGLRVYGENRWRGFMGVRGGAMRQMERVYGCKRGAMGQMER